MPRRFHCCSAAVCCVFVLTFSTPAWAERPTGSQLLPKETLVYLRIRDTQEFVKSFNETSIGRISQEEKIRPLVMDLYGSAAKAFARLEDEVGASLDEILAIPQGEIVFAVVGPRTGGPVLVAIIDMGDQLAAAEKLIESGERALANEGAVRSVETHGDTELVIHTPARNRDPLVHFIRENTLVITTRADMARQILDVWTGKIAEGKAAPAADGDEPAEPEFVPLSKNDEFITIMRRCRGTREDPAQFTFFIDPIDLFRVVARGNVGAQVGLALLPTLGLDGFEALGGSITFAAGEFDSISHVHVKLREPRLGIVKMIALESGDTEPERWVPADVGSYTTLNWNAEQTYSTLRELYDGFRGEGRLAADVNARISDQIGVDFDKEILGNLGGRFTYLTWYERPARFGSEAALIGLKLRDPKEFEPILEKLTDKYADRLEKKSYGRVIYWEVKQEELAALPAADDLEVDEGDRRRAQRRRQRQETLRTLRPSPCFAVIDDYLIVADRTAFLQKIITTHGDASQSLSKELDFKLIAGKVRRQVGGAKPALFSFSRPEEGYKVLYEMATGEETRQLLATEAEGNEFLAAIRSALERNELPPFSVLAQYLAPGGGMIVSDETGIHYTGFVLKRK